MDCAGIKVSRNWCLWFFIRARCTGPSPRHNEGNPNSAMAETKPGYCSNASSSKGIIPRAQLSMALQGRYLRQKGDSQERLCATVMFEKIFSSYVFLYSSFISAYCCSSTVCILQSSCTSSYLRRKYTECHFILATLASSIIIRQRSPQGSNQRGRVFRRDWATSCPLSFLH